MTEKEFKILLEIREIYIKNISIKSELDYLIEIGKKGELS